MRMAACWLLGFVLTAAAAAASDASASPAAANASAAALRLADSPLVPERYAWAALLAGNVGE